MKAGVIRNTISEVETHVYDNRFSPFKNLSFPRFMPYEVFQEGAGKSEDKTADMLFEEAKNGFIEGKNALQKLID